MKFRYEKGVIFLILILAPIVNAYSQIWPKVYGDNFHSLIKDISEVYDRGLYLTAFTYDNQGVPEYGWIIKTDINGNILWDKKYGDGNYRNWFSSSYTTFDNGLIIAGITSKYSTGDNDPVFIKTNTCGELEWCEVFQSPDQNYGTGILQLSDGSYIGMLQYYGEGETYARISLVKMDQSGEPVWIQRQSQEDSLIYNEEGSTLILTSSGNFLISGSCNHPGWRPYFILTDTSGIENWDIIWSSAYGHAFQTIEHQPGIFYSIGFKLPSYNNMPAIYKFDGNGNQLDDLLILSDTIYKGGGGAIMKINDSTLLTGIVWSSVNNHQLVRSEVVKMDTLGNLINRRILILDENSPTNLLLTSDDKLLAAGNYFIDGNIDIYLWKMNTDLEDDTLFTQPLTYDSLCPYQIQSDTVDLDCGIFVNIDELPTREEYESTIKISPNPARDWITLTLPDVLAEGKVELVVYDIIGMEAWGHGGGEAGKRGSGMVTVNRMVSLDVSGFSSGMYVAVVVDQKGRRYTGKFLVW